MHRHFVDQVDSISEDGVVRFVNNPGGFRVAPAPDDVFATLRGALRSGAAVRVVFDEARRIIEDALLDGR